MGGNYYPILRPPSLSELTPIIFSMRLTHLGSEISISLGSYIFYIICEYTMQLLLSFFYFYFYLFIILSWLSAGHNIHAYELMS